MSKIRAKGRRNGDTLEIEAMEVIEDSTSTHTFEASGLAVNMDKRRVIVMIVNTLDAPAAFGVSTAESMFFTGSASVNSFFQETSYGHVGIEIDADNNGQVDVVGPFTINYSMGSSSCGGNSSMTYAAKQKAQELGVDLSQ